MPAPRPRAHQCAPLMPLPMNSTASRFGRRRAASLPRAAASGSDSSHGSASATPTPRSILRLEIMVAFDSASARDASDSRLREKLHAHGRRSARENAGRLQPSLVAVEAGNEDRIGVLVADGEKARRRVDPEMTRLEAARPLV